jgi:hypothetical protein
MSEIVAGTVLGRWCLVGVVCQCVGSNKLGDRKVFVIEISPGSPHLMLGTRLQAFIPTRLGAAPGFSFLG